MLSVSYSSRFKRDLKAMQKRGKDMTRLYKVMLDLENEMPLDPKYMDHYLHGEHKGYKECHIEPDWLLIYLVNKKAGELYFARTGSHSDLFE